MKIVLYFINWNDSYYLPFIKKHYSPFVQHIIMYDNWSNDGSQAIAKQLGFEVRTFGWANRLDDQDYLNVKNHCWKEQRNCGVDLVIVCDADEFVQPYRLTGTAPVVAGYNMISDTLPVKDIFEVNTGAKSESYSKQAIFSPDHIDEIDFVHGCHKNHMKGNIIRDGYCKLFHFRQIGGVQRLLDKHATYRPRMSKFNLKNNMGHHYLQEDEQKRQEWNLLMQNAQPLW